MKIEVSIIIIWMGKTRTSVRNQWNFINNNFKITIKDLIAIIAKTKEVLETTTEL